MMSVVGIFHGTSVACVLIVEERGLASLAPTLLLRDWRIGNYVCWISTPKPGGLNVQVGLQKQQPSVVKSSVLSRRCGSIV